MSVTEGESGIVESHIQALERTAASENTFIFVRPTEYESTILIRAGYATKSVDVHHKSSNWGPMSGFVPCDPAFSKKCEGAPNPDEHERKHGDAHPVLLALPASLLAEHQKIEFQTDYVLAPAAGGGDRRDVPWIVKRQTGGGAVASARARFEAFQTVGHIPEHKFCTAKPADFGNKATLFCLIVKAGDWLVCWVKWEGETGMLYPLRVFAYPQRGKLNPVTGDYDLWMVAPHFNHLDAHLVVRLQKDSHGSSAASGYTMSLIRKMNSGCGRSDNPVFHHGAESQNYEFTQALDWNLAMFTAGGQSRMVRMNQMPGILADLQQAGYLVVWNARYGEADPMLMGKASFRGAKELGEIRAELDVLFRELDEIRRTADPALVANQVQSSGASGAPKMPNSMQVELGLMAKRFDATRKLGTEQSRIYRFHRKLLEFLAQQSARLRVLSMGDFPSSVRRYEAEVLRLHSSLQLAMVNATTGSGQANEQQLHDWLQTNRTQIERLNHYWQ